MQASEFSLGLARSPFKIQIITVGLNALLFERQILFGHASVQRAALTGNSSRSLDLSSRSCGGQPLLLLLIVDVKVLMYVKTDIDSIGAP